MIGRSTAHAQSSPQPLLNLLLGQASDAGGTVRAATRVGTFAAGAESIQLLFQFADLVRHRSKLPHITAFLEVALVITSGADCVEIHATVCSISVRIICR